MKKFFFVFFTCFISCLAFAQPSSHYAILLDAGSSGTRVHVFHYQSGVSQFADLKLEELSFQEKGSNKSSTPLSETDKQAPLNTFSKPFGLAMDYLHAIPAVSDENISVFVYSTAGMRVLAKEKRDEINQSIDLALHQKYPKLFSVEVRTIPGQEEALFLWLDVNYLKGNLVGNDQTTTGVIDVGGASAQIAYEVLNPVLNSDISYEKFHFFEKDVTLYLNSILFAGQDQARHLMEGLWQDKINPCYLKNSTPSVQNALFDAQLCRQSYENVLHSESVQSENPYSIREIPNLPENIDFLATSGVYYIENFFGAKNNTVVTLRDLETQIQEFCGKDWNEFQSLFPASQDKYLPERCANGVYIEDLLTQGAFHYPEEKPLTVASSLLQNFGDHSSHDVDWTLGALLFNIKP